jgi:hypothetical protein
VSWRTRCREGDFQGSAIRRLSAVALPAIALAAACALSVSASAAPGSDAHALKQPATQTLKKTMWGPTELNGKSLFPTYRDLGVGIYAMQVRWNEVAPDARPEDPRDPNDPAYEWPAGIADAISEAASYGMHVQIMIMGTPPWANDHLSWEWAPDHPSDFGDFAAAIAGKYPTVHLWMIWGEPNRQPNFQPLFPGPRNGKGPLDEAQALAPHLYARLLDSAYAALKGVNPANLVIGGNTFTASGFQSIRTYQWIRYLRLPDGSRPRMDMWGHNPFSFRKPKLKGPRSKRGVVTFSDLRWLAQALDHAYPDQRLKLYLSEWGVPIGFKDKDLLYSLRPAQGANWIRAAYRISRRWKRIYTLGWIHVTDTKRSSQGLFDSSGKRKSAYKVFKRS